MARKRARHLKLVTDRAGRMTARPERPAERRKRERYERPRVEGERVRWVRVFKGVVVHPDLWKRVQGLQRKLAGQVSEFREFLT